MKILSFQRWFLFIIALVSVASQAGQYETGLIFATEEQLNSLSVVPRYRAYLPESVDLSYRFPPAGIQGGQGSCVGWAVAYGARSYYNFKSLEITPDSKLAFSPAFIYNLIKDRDGKCQSGSSIIKALNLVRDQGVPRMSDFPYLETNCTRTPSEVVINKAGKHKIRDFKLISNIESVKGELYRGHPVIVGMMVSDSFEKLQGRLVYNDEQSQPTGGHAMVITGYDDKRRAFRVFNSWGPSWGENGFGWVGYQAMAKRGKEFYTIEVVLSSESLLEPPVQTVTPPSPLPAPPPLPLTPAPTASKVDRREVQAIAESSECSSIKALVSDKGEISLSGFAGDQSSIESIVEKLKKLKGVRSVVGQVETRPWPLCEAMKTLELTTRDPQSLSLSLIGQATPELRDNEKLSFDIQIKTKGAYLYVDYLQSSGDAVTLERARQIVGSKALRLPQAGKRFVVQAPFGAELLVAIISPTPLLNEGAMSYTDREYLSALRQGLLRLSPTQRAQVISSTISIRTRAR